MVADTQNWKSLLTGLISLEGVAVVTGEAAGPVVLIAGEDSSLESKSSVERW